MLTVVVTLVEILEFLEFRQNVVKMQKSGKLLKLCKQPINMLLSLRLPIDKLRFHSPKIFLLKDNFNLQQQLQANCLSKITWNISETLVAVWQGPLWLVTIVTRIQLDHNEKWNHTNFQIKNNVSVWFSNAGTWLARASGSKFENYLKRFK